MMGSVPMMVRTWTMASGSRKAVERKKGGHRMDKSSVLQALGQVEAGKVGWCSVSIFGVRPVLAESKIQIGVNSTLIYGGKIEVLSTG